MIDKILVQKARQTNLAEYLLSVGVPLVQNGHRHAHKEHDSLIFTQNAYYWNSRQEKGNAVDYLTRNMGMTFGEAVEALTGYTPVNIKNNIISTTPTLDNLRIAESYRRAIAYLHKARKIDYGIIQTLVNDRHIMQEERTNNAIFPMYDENGAYVGAELEGTLSNKRFKGVSGGSAYGYGFNVRFADTNGCYQYALFFESAVDLISFMDIKRNHDKKPLTGCLLVSMAGLKPNIVQHTLKSFLSPLQAFLCVDNDEAGVNFVCEAQMQIGGVRTLLPPSYTKDWNEQLQKLKSGN